MPSKQKAIAKGFRKFSRFIPCLFVVALFYFWCASWGTFSFNQPESYFGPMAGDGPVNRYGELGDHSPTGRYGQLAEGFLRGQLSLSEEPDPRLSQLPDPYNPAQNYSVRVHDTSLYNGKLYLYFGPVPAILAYLPYHFLTGSFPDQRWVTAAFCTLSFFVLSLLLILATAPVSASEVFRVNLLILLTGFGNLFPYFLARSGMYEVAISAGSFTTAVFLASMYLAARAKKDAVFESRSVEKKPSKKKTPEKTIQSAPPAVFLGMASAACGLGVGCRPHLILLIIPLFGGAFILAERKDRIKWGLVGLLPLSVCGALLALYNYERFGDLFEFGTRYQLAGMDLRGVSRFNLGSLEGWKRVVTYFYMYLFKPPTYSSSFPFISLAPHPIAWLLPQNAYGLEPVVGVLFGMPFVVLSFAAYFKTLLKAPPRLADLRQDPASFALFIAVFSFLLILGLLILIATVGSTARYMIDFSGVLGFAAALLWFRQKPHPALFAVVFIYVMAFGFFTGIQGYANYMDHFNPELMYKIRGMFW
jgi:hypothetical protein